MKQDAEIVFEFVKTIPRGKVMSYKGVGRALGFTARQIGNIMAMDAPNIPWWRVMASSGALSIGKRDPSLAEKQRHLLENEKVPFKPSGKVNMAEVLWSGDSEADEDGI